MNEEWKIIPNYENYKVSNFGNVKNINYRNTGKELLLKGSSYNGYIHITLTKNNKSKTFLLHRLVAECFIPNIENKPCINHKDCNPQNNRIDNLEWCTYGHNEKEAYRLGLKKPRIKEKEVVQLTKDYKIVSFWKSVNEIKKELGYSAGNICEVCNCNRKSAYGYIWRYVKDE